eukprot:g77181.t1
MGYDRFFPADNFRVRPDNLFPDCYLEKGDFLTAEPFDMEVLRETPIQPVPYIDFPTFGPWREELQREMNDKCSRKRSFVVIGGQRVTADKWFPREWEETIVGERKKLHWEQQARLEQIRESKKYVNEIRGRMNRLLSLCLYGMGHFWSHVLVPEKFDASQDRTDGAKDLQDYSIPISIWQVLADYLLTGAVKKFRRQREKELGYFESTASTLIQVQPSRTMKQLSQDYQLTVFENPQTLLEHLRKKPWSDSDRRARAFFKKSSGEEANEAWNEYERFHIDVVENSNMLRSCVENRRCFDLWKMHFKDCGGTVHFVTVTVQEPFRLRRYVTFRNLEKSEQVFVVCSLKDGKEIFYLANGSRRLFANRLRTCLCPCSPYLMMLTMPLCST